MADVIEGKPIDPLVDSRVKTPRFKSWWQVEEAHLSIKLPGSYNVL
jgi:hypothetical protein